MIVLLTLVVIALVVFVLILRASLSDVILVVNDLVDIQNAMCDALADESCLKRRRSP